MKIEAVVAAAATGLILFSGCATQPVKGTAGGLTQTTLAGNNYKIIKTGVKGESTGFKFIGIPITSPSEAEAKANMNAAVGEDLTGRAIGFVNQTEDRHSLWLILFSIPKITMTADVVEFVDKK